MKARHFIVLLFAAAALLFFREALFLGRAEIPCNTNRWEPWRRHASPEEIAPPAVNTDCALAYYPRRAFATRWMSRGELPLWDPTTFCGQPFLANFQSALLYPVNLALYGTEPMRAMGIFLAIHFLLAGWFAYRAARSFGIGRGGAAAAALVFEMNPFFLTRLGHPTFVATAAWLPLILFAGNRLVRKPGASSIALLAGSLALAATAGFPQTLMHLYYALAWLLLLSWAFRDGRRPGRILAAGGAAVLLSFALAAFQFLPTAEFLRHSTRDPVDAATFLSGTHHPAMLLRALVPDLFGNPMEETLWSTLFRRGNGLFRQNYVSTINYFGILPLAFGVYGILRGRRRFLLAGLFLLPLLVIWGTPLARAAFHFPGFRYSRPDRLILLPLFAAAMGFGFGVERLARREGGGGKVLPAALALLALAGAAAAFLPEEILRLLSGGRTPPGAAATARASGAATTAAALLGIGLLLFRRRIGARGFVAGAALLAFADLFLFGTRFHLALPPESLFRETPEIRAVRESAAGEGRLLRFGAAAYHFLPPATASLFGIDDAGGINALNLERYRRLWERVEPGLYTYRRYLPLQRPASLESPILSLVGARVWTVRGDGSAAPVRSADPLPRASLHFRWDVLPAEEILDRIGRPLFDPADTLFLEEEPPAPPPPLHDRSVPADTRIERYEPDRVTVRVESPAPAFLLLTDAWYPGWTAEVDGDPAKVYRADYAFRAVHVPAGGHVVDFRYRPASFRAGAAVSAAAAVLVALLAFFGRRRRRGP